jgi:hypothetical protein
MRPAQAVDPKLLEGWFLNSFLSFDIWSKEGCEKIEKLGDSDNLWSRHDVVVVSIELEI